MIIYNITVSIDSLKADEWLNWMRSKHIPDVMATACFTGGKISRIQGEVEGEMTFQ